MDLLDKRIINYLGDDLPVTERPFEALAREIGLSPDEVVAAI
ncbi:MAG: AsnC family protein, partial [Proteobacteria bacterium]|nr:AsnC family protein [Pseudomonadota bacterium]